MQHPNPHGSGNPNGQSPSVPLTVYRELAAELQATQAMLDSLHAQNQQLSRENQNLSHQNQQLLSEVHNVVNSALSLGQIADALHGATHAPADLSPQSHSSPRRSEALPQLDRPQGTLPANPPKPGQSQDPLSNLPPLYPNNSPSRQPSNPTPRPRFPAVELNGVGNELSAKGGLWLLIAIFAIIITAFGAGYWFMRPIYERLLQPQSSPQPQPQQPYRP
ncbi:hypothetical protein NEA10_04625 [Phormidium yuhuli AB48]|uniref:Uncharacterized protein n=1 Tax=Phormidium yuhuli AB48 TaxID=2940671 RepID=A0ABY5AS18_9CYAN|nr:hypothetical protein [Phormidium yuhuli]USR92014.1 hypothetical protein NEA10_04625 [Phormidium yuhuli AB48]